MFVGMWMTEDVMTVEPTTLVTDVAKRMAIHRIRRLPVLASSDPLSPLVGIVSASDVLHAYPAKVDPFASKPGEGAADTTLTVADVMTADPLTTTVDAPIESCAATLRDRKIGALPVLKDGVLIGLITESDVFRAFTSIFDLGVTGARITFDISQGEDVLPFITEATQRHKLRVTSFVSLHGHARPMCVVHVAGDAIDALLEDVWKSHHRLESVLRTEPEPETESPPK
jgi:acetoin utilization protein AcuB